MKKTVFTRFAAATLILAAVACQKENFEGGNAPQTQENLVPMTITASLEADTKAALQEGGKVFWEEGDAMTVLSVAEDETVTSYEFSTTGSGEKADFTGLVDEETINLSEGMYAVYPPTNKNVNPYLFYNTANGYTGYTHTISSGAVKMFLPSIQKATSDASSVVSLSTGVVHDADRTLNMKNVGGLIALTIPSNDITSVVLYGNSGENIAGVVTASFDDMGIPVVSEVLGSNVIRIVPSQSTETFSAATYYINVPPTTFDNGLTLLFINKEDKYAFVRSSDSFVVERAKISYFPTIPTLNFFGKVVRFAFFDDYGVFSNPLNATSKESSATDKILYLPSSSSVAHSGTYVYYDKTYDNAWEIKGSNYVMQNSGKCGGLVFGNKDGDYLALPKIDGFVLNKVIMRSGLFNYTNSGDPALTIKPDSKGSYVHITGCDTWSGNKQGGMEHIWSFAGNLNDDYAITLTANISGTQCCRVQGLLLFYSEAPEAGCPSVNPMITKLECQEPIVDYTDKKITFVGNFSAIDYSDISQFTCGFDYKLTSASEWTSVTCSEPAVEFSSEVTPDIYTVYAYRPWVRFVKKDGQAKTVYGDEYVIDIDLSKIVLSLVFDDSYYDKTPEGENANFLVREWDWRTNQNNSYKVKPEFGEMNNKSYNFNYLGVPYPFTFYSLQGTNYEKVNDSGETETALWAGGYTLRVTSDSKQTYGLCMCYISSDAELAAYPAWMQFPGVEGFKLKEVKVTTSGKNGFLIASDVVTDESAAETVLGTAKEDCVLATASNAYNHSLTLEDTIAGKGYYLCTVQNRVTIRNLTLTYEYAGE